MIKYIPKGVAEASRILSKPANFLIYGDPDIDGVVSYELVRRVLERYQKPYYTYINDNRQHGLKLTSEELKKLTGYTIILVDAGMTREELEFVTSHGVNIINIDHHHIDYQELVYVRDPVTQAEGVIINNQYPFEPENMRFLSGAGMVYFTFKSMFPVIYGYDEMALVGLSLLSDIRPLDEQLAKQFLYVTYNHKSPYIQYLIDLAKSEKDFGFGQLTFDRNFIDYSFSPRINALFRLNKGYEAIEVFKGTYTNANGQLTVYRDIQKGITQFIVDNLQGVEFSNLIFKYVDSDLQVPYTYEITNFIGLACSQVKNSGKTTILFVKEGDKIKRGSLRGLCNDVDYLGILKRHGFQAEGHHNAFGIMGVDFDKLDLEALNRDIALAEQGYEERKYKDRVIYVENLNFFLNSQADKIAEYNNYVREHQRYYIKYTGKNYESHEKGKALEFIIDGIRVVGFSHNLSLERDLILPLKERGKYINFYLQPY